MYTKQQIWDSFAKELHIIKHLAEKIPAGQEHHKPTEKQRTTLELLQYLAVAGVATMDAILTGDMSPFPRYADRQAAVSVESFAAAIDTQEVEMKALYEKFDDELLAQEISLFGMTQPRALFLLDLLKTMTGYKMQLFLYAKASGAHHIGTSNVWGGMDTAPKV